RPTTEGDQSVDIELTGEGITPEDVSGIPAQVVIPDGSASVSIDFVAVNDGIDEGPETLTIVCTTYGVCGYPVPIPVSVVIADYEPITISAEDLSLQCDRDSVLLEPLVEGGLGALDRSWSTGSSDPAIYVPGTVSANYVLSITDECPRTATATVEVLSGCS